MRNIIWYGVTYAIWHKWYKQAGNARCRIEWKHISQWRASLYGSMSQADCRTALFAHNQLINQSPTSSVTRSDRIFSCHRHRNSQGRKERRKEGPSYSVIIKIEMRFPSLTSSILTFIRNLQKFQKFNIWMKNTTVLQRWSRVEKSCKPV